MPPKSPKKVRFKNVTYKCPNNFQLTPTPFCNFPPPPSQKPVAKKAKAAKKAKDPNKPKRVMSSYMYWMTKEGREAAKKSLGAGASIGEIAKEVRKFGGGGLIC